MTGDAEVFLEELKALNLQGMFTASELFTSMVLVTVILVVRRLLIGYVWRDAEVLAKEQRNWIIRIKNISASLLLIGLILIWAPQLHTFALSIAAFAAAVVLATKEMILCLTGGIMRVSTQPFKATDWISIDGTVGEVVDVDMFAFKVQEVDIKNRSYHFTGRTITVPNSKIFSSTVENYNFFKAYVFEDVKITVLHTNVDPEAASLALREIVEKHFTPHRADAQAFNRKIRRRSGFGIGSAEPVYDLATTDGGNYIFSVKLFVPTVLAARLRGDITREFIAYVYGMRLSALEKPAAAAVSVAPADDAGEEH